MNDPGFNALAAIVAWWLAHPFRLIGVMCLYVAAKALTAGFFGAIAGVRPREKGSVGP